MRTGGKILIDQLIIQGCRTLFTVPGESFLAALDALFDEGPIRTIVCRHEGAAAMMAEACGKLTGEPGVAFVTRAAGAANAVSGVYVAQLGGGQVNTATGDFVFGMTEAYLIEDGEITEPIREGNLIGNGPEVLTRIDALGNDFAMGSPGTCGKDGQGVPVGDGTPTLRVTSLTVGGTAA